MTGLLLSALLALMTQAPTYPDGCVPFGSKEPNIIGCTMSRDGVAFGRPMPAGSLLHYDAAGTYKYFEFRKPFTYDGYLLAGSGDGPHHMVYPDGAPRGIWLSTDQEVQGVPCRKYGVFTEIIQRSSLVRFHPNGKLAGCRVSRKVTIQGVEFGKGAAVAFDVEGKLVR